MFDRCRDWQSLMTRRAEGLLSPSERALLDNHIAACAPCREAQEADTALAAFAQEPISPAGTAAPREFDDQVVNTLREIARSETPLSRWQAQIAACASSLSFEFCAQLAGGGLAAAAITAFLLVSALNPAPNTRPLSTSEARAMSALKSNEPPVPLESLFQAPTPRAAMLWAAPPRQPDRVEARLYSSSHPSDAQRKAAAPWRAHGGRHAGLSLRRADSAPSPTAGNTERPGWPQSLAANRVSLGGRLPANTIDRNRYNMSSANQQVIHIVLLQWKPDASPEAIEEAFQELRALSGKIPGILDLTCGANFTDRSKGYTHGIVVRFADRAALEAYLPHPEHQRVVQEFMNPIRADALALDYTV